MVHKRWLLFLAVLVVAAMIPACQPATTVVPTAQPTQETPQDELPTATLESTMAPPTEQATPTPEPTEEGPYTLTIMHTNDTHAHHEPDSDGNGGAAIQAAVVAQIRAETPNTLLVDGGDRFTGTLYHVQHRGQDSARIMNALQYDAMTLGNHEFDDGDEVLAQFIDALEFPVVSSNIDFSGSPDLVGKVQTSTVIEVGGEQIGILGLITPETDILSSPGDALVFNEDLTAAAQAVVDELTAQGVNKIVLLSHIGYIADLGVAQSVTGIDVIVGGHSHSLLSNTFLGSEGPYPTIVESPAAEPVLVVQAGTATKYLGRLDVEFDDAGVASSWNGDPILLSSYIRPDEEITTIIADLATAFEELRAHLVGETSVYLEGDRTVCRFEECNLGNLITDAMRAETGAQIAIENGGGIRASLDVGDITYGDVLTVLPFGNLTSTFSLTGQDVKAALENGVSRWDVEEGTGRFAQVSGLRYTFDPARPVGSRVTKVEVQSADSGEYEPLNLTSTYTVAANDFMRAGGDDYSVFVEKAINPYDFGRPLDQVVADYITENSPIDPETEGRITIIGVND